MKLSDYLVSVKGKYHDRIHVLLQRDDRYKYIHKTASRKAYFDNNWTEVSQQAIAAANNSKAMKESSKNG